MIPAATATDLGLDQVDPEVTAALKSEEHRQVSGLELIASENYASRAVIEALGTVFTNKYAEGYPGRRYYGGCETVDRIERLACDRALELFGGDHVNVQLHSGSAPNMAVYMAMLEPGDTLMGLSLAHGGHLTHGHPMNFSGGFYDVVSYGVDPESELIDYDQLESLALEHRPKLIVSGATAYPRTIDYARFAEIADRVGALHMCDMAHIAGLVAGGAHPNPVEHCDFVTSSTHKSLRGPRGGLLICRQQYAKQVDRLVFPGIQGGPFMNVIAAKAVAFGEALRPEFSRYAAAVVENAAVLAEALSAEGLRVVSGGTDNHIVLLDFGANGPSGKKMQRVLEAAAMTTNKNTVPRETRKPFIASGIRLGTPALTTRGMGPAQMRQIADWIARATGAADDSGELAAIAGEVHELAERFPVPAIDQSP